MADYSITTDFSVKDGLTTGDGEKIILGADFDQEFDDILTAIATKYDSGDLASEAEAKAGSSNVKLMTPLRVQDWAGDNGSMVEDIQALADPNADTVLGWDDSAGAAIGYTLHASLLHSGTELSVDHDAATNFVTNEHLDWTADLSSTNLHANNSANGVLALTSDEVTQLANIGSTTITSGDWTAVAALVGTNTGDQTSIVGISGTKSQFDTAVSDGNIAYSGGAHHDGFSDFVTNEHRDVTVSTSSPSGGSDGDVWFEYTA